jgi:hypothetical protein
MQEISKNMPVRCSVCGATFDLRYDLEDFNGEEQLHDMLHALATRRGRRMLCWKCRE